MISGSKLPSNQEAGRSSKRLLNTNCIESVFFPWTRIQQNGIEYIDHKRDAAVKYRLMSELQRNDLDIAILHHHGDVEIEYMNDLPEPQTIKDQVEGIKLYLRETMRHAREKGKFSTKANFSSIRAIIDSDTYPCPLK